MKNTCLLIFILLAHHGLAQQRNELPFIEHLIQKGYFTEVVHLINNDTINYNQSHRDSLFYYNGWAHYSLKNLEPSTFSFRQVGNTSAFYLKSRFFAGYNQIFLGKYDESQKTIGQLDTRDERISSLVNFELGGIDMLQGDWMKGELKLQNVNQNMAALNNQVLALMKICKEQEFHRSKSPFLAGLMSCLLPGSGKIYAGKTGQGIASLITTTGLGLITWENYHKLGFNQVKTILFGSIFAVTYISNIYGSVISVKIFENEYKDVLHNQILFQLHIPLRNFFE